MKCISGISEQDNFSLRFVLLNKNNRNNFIEDLADSRGDFKLVKAPNNSGCYLKYFTIERVPSEDDYDDFVERERCLWISVEKEAEMLKKTLDAWKKAQQV